MVMPMRVSALNRKLLRDLLAMKTQALAIAMVVAAGVTMFVMYLSVFSSLQETRRPTTAGTGLRMCSRR